MKHHWLKISLSIMTGLAVTLFVIGCEKKDATTEKATTAKESAAGMTQTLCPIMGEKIDKSLYVDADNYRIYVCCKACLSKVENDPHAAVAKIKANGETPELLKPLCAKCGEIKGSDKCCKSGTAKCSKCGMNAGSPGCCMGKAHDKDVHMICKKCGEVKGSEKCCDPDAVKCPKCGMNAGSPGCCSMKKSTEETSE